MEPERADAPRRELVLRPATILTALGLAAALALGLLFVWATHRVLVWVMIALFLALALDHVAAPLQRWLGRTQASLVAFVLFLCAFGLVAYLLVPPLVQQVTDFVTAAPELLHKLSQGEGPLGFLEDQFQIVERARRFVAREGVAGVLGFGQPLFDLLTSVATGIVAALAVTFLTLFMLIHGPAWRRNAIDFAPESQRGLWTRIADDIRRAIGGWVIGAAVLAAAAGATAAIVFAAIGAPYPIALGLVVAILDPVPFVGATLAAAITSLAVLASNGVGDALIVLGFLVAYQQVVENHVLVPLVYGRTVQTSSLAVLLAVLVGGELAGIVGAIAAIPVAGALKSSLGHVLEHRRSQRLEASAADLAALRAGEPAVETERLRT